MQSRLATSTIAILLVLMSAGAPRLQAQTDVSWIGSGGGNWNTPADWSGGVVPNNGGGKTYNVTIAPSSFQTVDLNLGVTISDLTLGNATATSELQSVAGDSLTIASGGSLTVNAGSTLLFNTAGSNITVGSGGTLTNNGSFDVEDAETLTVTGTTTNGVSATLAIEGGSTASFTGSLTNSGVFETGFSGGNNTVTVTGAFTNNSGATLELESSGDTMSVGSFTNSGTLSLAQGTSLTITGGGNGVTDVAAGTTYDIGGTFNVKNGSTTTQALAKLTTIEGTLTLSNGTNTTITPTGGTLTISNSGSLGVDLAASLTINGNVNNSYQFTTGFSGGADTVTVTGTFTNNSGATLYVGENGATGDVVNLNALSNSGTVEIGTGDTLNITGGGQGITTIAAGSILTVQGTLDVKNGSTFTNGLGNLTSLNGTLNLDDGITNAVTPNGGTLTIASGGELNLSDSKASTTTLAITGNVSNSGEVSTGFSGGTNTVTVSGTFTNTAGATVILYSGADSLSVNALSNSGILEIGDAVGSGATVTITGGGQGVTDVVAGSTIDLFGNFNVVNSGKTTSALSNLTTVAGLLNLVNSQALSVTPNAGTLTIASGGTLELSGTAASTTNLSITGSVSNGGNLTTGFAGGTNTVTISGTFTNNSGGLLELYAGNGSGGTDLVNIATLTNSGMVMLNESGSTLDITGTGTLTNNGTIDLYDGTLKFSSSSATLTGTGTLTLGNLQGTSSGVIQVGSSDTGTLTNSSTINGYGNLGHGTLTLVNKGTIAANNTLGTLTIQPGSGGVTNSGTLEAENQATLVLEGTYTNSGGTIEALGLSGGTSSSTVEVTAGTVINGGTLNTTTVGSNSGIIEGTGAVTLNGVTNSGTYAVEAGTTTTLEGTVTNNGSITLSGSTLSMGNSVTLNGKGTIVLSDSTTNLITGATSGLTLTTANTIEGAGTISNLGITNTGTIEANQSSPLIVLPSSAGFNNKGTLSVSTGDTMQVGTSAGGALLNYSGTTLTGGTYTVDGILEFGASGTSVVTDAANITLTGASAEIKDFAGQNVMTDLATITSAGSFTIGSGANFTTVGNFTNNGGLTVNTGSKFIVLNSASLTNFNSSTSTLTGGSYTVGGKLEFAGANIVTDAASITMDGTGEIENSTNSSNGLSNLATITSAGSFTLAKNANFTTVGNLTANGRLTVDSGSTLTITGSLTNFNSSTDTLTNGTYTVGGTMEFTGANIVNNSANLTITGNSAKILNGTTNGLANFANNTGSFTLTGDGTFTTGVSSGTFTNSGTIDVTKGSLLENGADSYVQSAGTTTIDGTFSAVGSGISVTGGSILGAGELNANVSVGGTGTAPTISAGDSGKAGLLLITGTYTQLSTGTMSSFIGGTTVGTQYSQLQVDGAASLAGTLTVKLASGFTPTIGSTFTVLTASSITGTFSNSTIAINSSEHFNVSYTSTGVILTVASGATPQSSGAPSASLVAVVPPKRQSGEVSGLRQHFGGTSVGNHLFAVGLEKTTPRSGAILAGEYELGRIESSNYPPSPVTTKWEHLPVAVTPLIQSESPSRNGLQQGVSSRPIPVTSTSIRREPVRLMSPMLPRLGR